jgi:subtilisin-like proprotein convertase family protein
VCEPVRHASTDVPQLVPDPGTVTSTLTITEGGTIADVDVIELTVFHTRIGDLTVALVSPSGTRRVLVDRVCGDALNLSNINFDDGAAQRIGDQCPPQPAGTFRPRDALAAFVGQEAAGTWSLEVADSSAEMQFGVLKTWSLRITTGLTCVTPTPTPEVCAQYSDVQPGQFFYKAVHSLSCREVVSGYADGTFRPFNPSTRAQTVKMIVLGEGWILNDPPQPTFTDVGPADWFFRFVETAHFRGIIAGYADRTFRPYNSVTRGQISKMIVLARDWPLLDPEEPRFSDVPKDDPFYGYVETAFSRGVVSGYADGTFRPGNLATRGQLARMLYAALGE